MATTKRALKAKRPKRVDRRKTTSTRITPETRARLEQGAAQSGRSLAQEIEFCLERSFLSDDAKFDDFGGKEKYALARLFAVSANLLEPRLHDMVKELQASGRLPTTVAKDSRERTWANEWSFFQFAVALWMQTAKQTHFEVPEGLEAFEAALRGGHRPDAGLSDMDKLGQDLILLLADRTEDKSPPD